MQKKISNPVIQDEVTFIQTAASTRGRITTLQVRLMPNGGTPLHYHKHFSETFIVLDGVLTLQLNKTLVHLSAGEKYTIEKRCWHRFVNESQEPVTFTSILSPGSAGFENGLHILYGLASDRKTNAIGIPKNPLALAVVAKISDMHPAGPRLLVNGSISLMYLLAKATGLQRRLLRRYCSDEIFAAG